MYDPEQSQVYVHECGIREEETIFPQPGIPMTREEIQELEEQLGYPIESE